MKPILLVVGTRPDAIKLLPVYFELKKENIPVLLCSTFQHDDLLKQVFDIFGVQPDIALHVMRHNQDLYYLTEVILQKIKAVLQEHNPSVVIVQGDTTTAFAASLATFYAHIPIMHIEAGIRTYDIYSPFPEEANRKLISVLARFNCAPTQDNVRNLLHEGVSRETIFQTGNTVTDALRIMQEKISFGDVVLDAHLKDVIQTARSQDKKLILLTLHRRESFGQPLQQLLDTIKEYAHNNSNVLFLYPVHPNPNVKKALTESGLYQCTNIIFFEPPLTYPNLVYALTQVDIVATDSGGIQEEAATLGKYTVVLRERTDRPESVVAGIASVVGCNKQLIHQMLDHYLYSTQDSKMTKEIYGDGFAAKKIVQLLTKQLNLLQPMIRTIHAVEKGI